MVQVNKKVASGKFLRILLDTYGLLLEIHSIATPSVKRNKDDRFVAILVSIAADLPIGGEQIMTFLERSKDDFEWDLVPNSPLPLFGGITSDGVYTHSKDYSVSDLPDDYLFLRLHFTLDGMGGTGEADVTGSAWLAVGNKSV